MFRVTLEVFAVIAEVDVGVEMALRLKKEHWHYILIDKMSANIVKYRHEFDLQQNQEGSSTFALQLISAPEQGRAKLIGQVIVDISEWPMNSTRRKKVKMSERVELDFQIHYEYVSWESDSGAIGKEELNWMVKEHQLQSVRQAYQYLKSQVQKLKEEQLSQMQQQSKLKNKQKQMKTQTEDMIKGHLSQKQQLTVSAQQMSQQLQMVNYKLTRLINLAIGQADITVINSLNNILASSGSINHQKVLSQSDPDNSQ